MAPERALRLGVLFLSLQVQRMNLKTRVRLKFLSHLLMGSTLAVACQSVAPPVLRPEAPPVLAAATVLASATALAPAPVSHEVASRMVQGAPS